MIIISQLFPNIEYLSLDGSLLNIPNNAEFDARELLPNLNGYEDSVGDDDNHLFINQIIGKLVSKLE